MKMCPKLQYGFHDNFLNNFKLLFLISQIMDHRYERGSIEFNQEKRRIFESRGAFITRRAEREQLLLSNI